MSDSHDLIIVGGGIAGCAAALRAAQNGLRTAWLLGDKKTAKRSRSSWVANLDNIVGFHDGIVRGKLIKELRGEAFADARRALEEGHHLHISTRDLIENTRQRLAAEYADRVEQLEFAAEEASRDGDDFVLRGGGRELRAAALVLATGVMDRQPSIRKEKGDQVLDEPRWIYPFANRESVLYCIRCEGHLTEGKEVAIIGHGPSAAELALMLHERYQSACCVLTNGESPQWDEQAQKLLDHYGIGVREERIVDVLGKKGELNGLMLEGDVEVRVRFALVSLGLYRVYNDLAVQLGAELADADAAQEERHVLVDRVAETSVRNLYAIGDMAKRADEPIMKQIYTAQEYAVRAVDSVDRRRRRALRHEVLQGLT